MWSSSVPLPFLAAAATAALLLLLASNGLTAGPRTALATHAGGADYIVLDMDPTGNTARSVGSYQPCARINRNGIQDADEARPDAVQADVVTGPAGIPAVENYVWQMPAPPFGAIAASVRFTFTPGAVAVVSKDVNFLLGENPQSSILDVSQPLPDADGDWTMEFADVGGDSLGETGPGVLARVTIAAQQGAPPGVYTISLEPAVHVDGNTEGHSPDNAFDLDGDTFVEDIPESRLAIDVPCPSTDDLQVTSLMVGAPPNPLVTGTTTVPVSVTIRNGGPEPVSGAMVGLTVDRKPIINRFSGNRTVIGYCLGNTLSLGPFNLPAGGVLPLGPQDLTFVCYRGAALVGTTQVDIGVRAGVAVPFPLLDAAPANNTWYELFPGITVVEADTDGDGVVDRMDLCPHTPPGQLVNTDGCSASQVDPDGDGVSRSTDLCPDTPAGAIVDANGCSLAQVDSDGDGICNPAAPSNGPWPGCVRSVAVGGLLGLLDDSSAPESTGTQSSSRSSTLPPVALAAIAGAAAGVAGLYLRRRRRT